MFLDLSQNWKLSPAPQTLAYYVKTAEGVWGTAVSVTHCHQNAITKDDILNDPTILQKDATVWHLWTEKLGAIIPKIGDLQVQGGLVCWRAVSVGMCDRDVNGVQRYRLVVIKNQRVPS